MKFQRTLVGQPPSILNGGVAARLAALVTAAALLSGCASTIESDPGARALLDAKTGAIVLPLDEYDYLQADASSESGLLIEEARITAISNCLRTKGYSFESGETYVGRLKTEGIEDRLYGLWDVQRAKKNGLSFPLSRFNADIRTESAQKGGDWTAAFEQCRVALPPEIVDVSPNAETSERESSLLIERVRTEARVAAEQNPEWGRARGDWEDCIRGRGLEPDGERGGTTQRNAEGVSEEERLRLAVIETECNQEVHLSQRLGDLEAGYQSALIRENQQAMNAAKAERDEKLAALKAYIERNG